MRRSYSATDHIARRAGVPCGPCATERPYEPPPAWTPPRREQCTHGGFSAPRCTKLGTWRTPEKLWRRRWDGTLIDLYEKYDRRCDDHRFVSDVRADR